MSNKLENITLDQIYEFLEYGNMQDAPPEIVEYMTLMEMVWRMHRRMIDYPDNDSIINFLTLTKGFKRPKAAQLLKDTLEFFYAENDLPVKTWRGIMADRGMKAFVAAVRVAKNSRDFKDSFEILFKLGSFLGWDLPEAEKPNEDFLRQLQVVTADIEMFDLPKAPRAEIAQWIDALPEISDKMKAKAKAEVEGVPFRLLYKDERPNE